MSYKLIKKLNSGIRIGELSTAHGKIATPFFMPVGTVGSVKGVTPQELKEMGAEIILCNTYHLFLRPGEQLIKKLGGLHKFIGWSKPILTDSGGYQVFSLGKDKSEIQSASWRTKSEINLKNQISKRATEGSLVKITDEGVEFKSHLDGTKHLFTPEKVIQIQLDLGVDILMPLDVCPSGTAKKEEVEKAVELTIKWAKRSKVYFDQVIGSRAQGLGSTLKPKPKVQRPILHGIVQGGLYPDLRKYCAEELIKLDFDGYSVGGLAVDNETRDMWKTVKQMGEILPEEKQRYLMGVGTPDDITKATKLGMDMFDCVLPTRMGRHGSVYTKCHPEHSEGSIMKDSSSKTQNDNKYKLINLLNSKYRTDKGVIDDNCGCYACQKSEGFSKAYISHLIRSNEILGIRLTTLHNLYQYLELMRELKKQ